VYGQAQQNAVSSQEGEGDTDQEGVITHEKGDSTETVREQRHDENAVSVTTTPTSTVTTPPTSNVTTPPTSNVTTPPNNTVERNELLQVKIEQVKEFLGAK